MVSVCLALAMASGRGHADDGTTVPPETAGGTVTAVEVRGASELGFERAVVVRVARATELAWRSSAQRAVPVLFVDGREVDGVHLVRNSVDASGDGALEFFIDRDPATLAVFGELVALHRSFVEELEISVGPRSGLPLPSGHEVPVVLARRGWFFTVLGIIVVLVGALVLLATRTDLLRDAGRRTWTDARPPSWSLSRLLMAGWTVSVLGSWLLLYVFRHTMGTIPDALVSLTGLSAGTTLTASAIEHREVRAARPSGGLVHDLLVVDGGMSFHRFQLLAWNAVALIILWRQVVMYLRMPEYPTSVLLLLGISSASYLGGKYTEAAPARAPSPTPLDPSELAAGTSTTTPAPTTNSPAP